jgi:hypothetical protein
MPTLEWCGMQGGIWYHATVKTNFFSNLVVSSCRDSHCHVADENVNFSEN